MKNWLVLLFVSGLLMACSHSENESTEVIKTKISGNWQFRQADSSQWHPATVPGTVHTDLLANQLIDDPFYRLNEKQQQWIDKMDWEYQTNFTISNDILRKQHIELVFEGLDTYADVFLNDQLILTADNMFRTWRIDCKPFLKAENDLRVVLKSPIKIGLQKLNDLGYQLPADNDQSENGGLGTQRVSIFTRKAGYHFGWDWGPRLVTSGIWRPVNIEVWNQARIDDVQIIQNQLDNDNANLTMVAEIKADTTFPASLEVWHQTNLLSNQEVQLLAGSHFYKINFDIKNPKLWWPNGLGEAFLYPITLKLITNKTLTDTTHTDVGLRTLRLVREPDADNIGESFYFEVNGRPVFAKGANYIPNDIFLPRVTPRHYEQVVQAAADANMNMLRVWGGGVYEDDLFYDLCDRHGILIWQDFMFACAMYPGDSAFLENVRHEAIDNVKRLRNHPSLALWCGNNEIENAWGPYDENRGWGWKQRHSAAERAAIWQAYDTLFHHILPQVVQQLDAKTPYWHSSPSAGMGKLAGHDTPSGDMHYWGVWHGQHPFSDFKKHKARFMSEYGFQSFPTMASVARYTEPQDWDLDSEVMTAHQRSGIGNQRIRAYMEQDYVVPQDFEQLLYVSQLLQAEAIRTAIEAHRGAMPYCMGSLYWQLNDVWPVASWSGIDSYGQWKALHYAAREAFKNTVVIVDQTDSLLRFNVVSDLAEPRKAVLQMEVLNFDGDTLFNKNIPITIPANLAQEVFAISTSEILAKAKPIVAMISARLIENDQEIDRALHYFVSPKEMQLPDPEITLDVTKTKEGLLIALSTNKLVKNLFLMHASDESHFSDNFFDVPAGERKEVFVATNISVEDFRKGLRIMHLKETLKK
ncbi:MAG: glycoside hydrolase family 2 protein [Bacteroidales bacterium]|nr:glycoside hydrolase family 2 protein [Bacteroidales bacterium]